jgi:S1-C subfamily serine protease
MVVQGTSWLIHPRFAVTNEHVIEGIRSSPLAARTSGDTQVLLYSYPDRQPVRGRVVGVDEERDVAIIELLGSVGVAPIPVSDRPAVVGEPVMYVGHPSTMKQLWITGLGVVTGYQAPLSAMSVTSTAPAHPGSSGSPLVNLDGEVLSLVTGSSHNFCSYVESVECIADASVQYASLPVGPTASRGIDGPAIRQFFTQVTGEALPPVGASTGSSGERVLVDAGSVGSFAVYRDRERASERGRTTTMSGFPVSERDTVEALYERVAEAVFIVETAEGGPMGTAWLAGPTTVVTNEHVSTPARSGNEVFLRRRDGSQLTARIVEDSVRDDLTILRLDAPIGTTPLAIAPRNVGVDVPVFYVGHPNWMEQAWITGLGVTTGYDARHRNRMLTTVPSESGASGSPILNLDGEVVASNSFRTSGAIPAGGYPVADRDDLFFSVPVSPGSGGVDASTLRAYVERHLD